MRTTFQNLDDEHDPRNGQVVDVPAAVTLLDELRKSKPAAMCEFIGDNGFRLTVGVVNAYGCIEYSQNDGLPPYLMAVDLAGCAADSADMEFVVGGTLTPIDSQYRVPFNTIREVLLEFMETGQRSEAVAWQDF